jgi:hypothetical protein
MIVFPLISLFVIIALLYSLQYLHKRVREQQFRQFEEEQAKRRAHLRIVRNDSKTG